MRGFAARVLAVVRRVPPGRVATYGDVATLAGRPLACRAVGNIMRACTDPGVPCHRVVAAGGRLGGYAGQEALKRALLRAEGIAVVGSRIPAFRRIRWRGTNAGRPGVRVGPDETASGAEGLVRRPSLPLDASRGREPCV